MDTTAGMNPPVPPCNFETISIRHFIDLESASWPI